MKKLFLIFIIGFALYSFLENNTAVNNSKKEHSAIVETSLLNAYKNKQSDLQVSGSGKVSHILLDDTKDSQHQKFILKLSTGQSVLISHNIDLAPRINILKKGDSVKFYGEYEWNSKGGVIHWTHHDPGGRHKNGWLQHKGRIYQ